MNSVLPTGFSYRLTKGDPLYDAGHDSMFLEYPQVRAIAKHELERRGLAPED